MVMSTEVSRRRQWYAKHLGYIPGERRRGELKGFNGLPPELLTRIFRHLDAFDLIMCSLVCKRWHDLASDDYVWKSLYESARSASKGKGGGPSFPNNVSDLAGGFKQLYLSNGVAMRAMYIRRIVEQVKSKAWVKSDPRTFNAVNQSVLKRYPADAVLTLFDSERRVLYSASRSLRPDSASACLLLTYSLADLASPPSLSRVAFGRLDLRVPLYSISELRRPGERGPFSCRTLLPEWNARKDGQELKQADPNLRVLLACSGQLVCGEWRRGGGLAFIRLAVRQSQLEATFRSLESERAVGDERGASGTSTRSVRSAGHAAAQNNTGSVEIRCGSEVTYFGSWRSFDFDADGVAVPAEGSTMAEPLRSGGLCLPWKSGGLSGHVQRLLHLSACVKNFVHCKRGHDALVWDANGFCELLPLAERSKVDYDLGGDLHEAVLATESGRVRVRFRLPGDAGEEDEEEEEEGRGRRKTGSGGRAFVVGVTFQRL